MLSLTWDLFLAPSIPAITSDVPPGETERPRPPISSPLISGARDAVLVDTPITVEQARAFVNWVVARGKNLTTIYATHEHGDHFFGTSTVLERFPGARFVARPDVIKVMRQQAAGCSAAGPCGTWPWRSGSTEFARACRRCPDKLVGQHLVSYECQRGSRAVDVVLHRRRPAHSDRPDKFPIHLDRKASPIRCYTR